MTKEEKYALVKSHWDYIEKLLHYHKISPTAEVEVCYWQGFYDGLEGKPYNDDLGCFHYDTAFEHGDKHRGEYEAQ